MSEPALQDAQRRRLENLQAVLAGPAAKPGALPPAAADSPGRAGRERAAPGHHRARNTLLGGAGAAGLFILGKLKFLGLLAGVFKLNTLATMILSVGLYAIEWGVPFAVGFVLLIFVHECGHAIVLRREGIPAGAPVFIPFLGAVIAMRGMPRDAYVEAKVGLGGPVLGSLAAWAVLWAGHAAGNPMLVNIGHAGILINLFNLIPVAPLDGGRIAGAFSRSTLALGLRRRGARAGADAFAAAPRGARGGPVHPVAPLEPPRAGLPRHPVAQPPGRRCRIRGAGGGAVADTAGRHGHPPGPRVVGRRPARRRSRIAELE